jgi:phage recombination protein Bet
MTTENQWQPSSQIVTMAERLNIDSIDMNNIIISSVMPANKNVSNEQFTIFLSVANEYQLNPITKEIYAFPTKGGGIQPVVSIDGWLRIINQNPAFDGMEFQDHLDNNGVITAVTCRIYRTDRKKPVEVTEYLNECQGETVDRYKNKTPWGKYPARMLRHKATIQAARYAFGLSGIIDPDEADRYEEAGVIERDITPEQPKADVSALLERGMKAVAANRKTAAEIIEYITVDKELELSEEDQQKLKDLEVEK